MGDYFLFIQFGIAIVIVLYLLSGIRIVRPTHRSLIERLGKYRKFAEPGFHWVIPIIDRIYKVNVTEQMMDAEKQTIITNDNLTVTVDAQIYFKVNPSEDKVKKSQYCADKIISIFASLLIVISFERFFKIVVIRFYFNRFVASFISDF